MKPSEIREAVVNGEMSPEQAMLAWRASRAENPPTRQTELVQTQPMRGLPEAGQLNIAEIQAKDRESLARVRSDLALQIENRSARHEYQRQYVEESARHGTALIAVGLLGIADGVLEGVGYGISEIAETFTYTFTRTARRIKEGFYRGRTQ